MNTNNPDQEDTKSQRKRDMTALQKLGEKLVNLPESQLARIPLDSTLLDAVNRARSIKSHEAKRRQLQYIGKIMRSVDPEPIQAALDKIENTSQEYKAGFHKIERWRDRLLTEGDTALEQFINEFPESDHQYLRQLARKAQQDYLNNKKSGAERELFRYVRDLIENRK